MEEGQRENEERGRVEERVEALRRALQDEEENQEGQKSLTRTSHNKKKGCASFASHTILQEEKNDLVNVAKELETTEATKPRQKLGQKELYRESKKQSATYVIIYMTVDKQPLLNFCL